MTPPQPNIRSSVRRQSIILGLIRFSEALAWSTVFPYAFFMMQSLLAPSATRDAKAATFASATVSLFTFGEFLTAVLWAKISDRVGRKSTLLIGAVGGCISALGFGLSSSLAAAIAARFLGGVLNPNVAVVSVCVGEVIGVGEGGGKGAVFLIVPFLRGLGSLIGPVVGGYLAQPVKAYPSLFPADGILKAYPYLLPNLVVAACIFISGLLTLCFLEETYAKIRNRVSAKRGLAGWASRVIKALVSPGRAKECEVVSHREEDTIELQSAVTSADVEQAEADHL
ncbi:major facilitator superfamily domain-containing protein [Aspergillus karnatakaensis]|uniref:major facilitator superfamily domain-containing protein n=1 Tax=Aspergillus karnatakaensis TaxID=1810916 RepID=UPI003CCE3CB5